MSASSIAATSAPRRQSSVVMRAVRFRRTQVGLALTGLVVLFALVGPLFSPHSPSALVAGPFEGSSSDHLLGTDYLGHDVLSRLLWGGRSILWMSVAAAVLGVVVGATIGLFAGYSGRLTENFLMRPLDVVQGFPIIVLVLLFVSLLGHDPWLMVLLVAVAWVPSVARVTRAMTAEVVTRDYIAAAETIGLPRHRILVREVLPNITTPLLVELALRLTWSIAAMATLSFIGAGLQPPASDWGLMINENRTALTITPLPVIAPSVLIALFSIGTSLIADGVGRTIARVDHVSSS